MKLNFDEACHAVKSFAESDVFPGVDPYYVVTDSKRDPSLEPFFWIHENEGNKFFLSGHLSRLPDPFSDLFDFQSPYGYGGAVSSTNSKSFLQSAWIEAQNHLRDQGVVASFFRYHPVIGNSAMAACDTFFNRKTVAVDLSADFRVGYQSRVRTAIKKAGKELDLKIFAGSEVSPTALWMLYIDAMKSINASSFYFFPESYFESLVKIPGIFVVMARNKTSRETVGFAFFLSLGSTTEYHLAGVLAEGRKLSAANLILDAGLEHAKKLGQSRVHLGGGRSVAPDDSLLFFKEGFSEIHYDFRIGGDICNFEKYEQLRRDFLRKNGKVPNRILFYR